MRKTLTAALAALTFAGAAVSTEAYAGDDRGRHRGWDRGHHYDRWDDRGRRRGQRSDVAVGLAIGPAVGASVHAGARYRNCRTYRTWDPYWRRYVYERRCW